MLSKITSNVTLCPDMEETALKCMCAAGGVKVVVSVSAVTTTAISCIPGWSEFLTFLPPTPKCWIMVCATTTNLCGMGTQTQDV